MRVEDALDEVLTRRRVVGEVLPGHHVARVAHARKRESLVQAQPGLVLQAALRVQEAERRPLRRLQRDAGGGRVAVRGGSAVGQSFTFTANAASVRAFHEAQT